jgi:Rieske Fe-S protein
MNVIFERLSQAPGASVHFVKDRLVKAGLDDAGKLNNGQGSLVQSGDRKLAVYRDDDGELHVMSPVCTHLKCIVGWNAEDRTWDCPCHGSRFDALGKVIDGPATKDLLPDKL